MNKLILLGASWCPVTKETKEFFNQLKKERSDFDYEYIDIDSERGKELVEKFSVTDVPKIIIDDKPPHQKFFGSGGKIVFHGKPSHQEMIKLLQKN